MKEVEKKKVVLGFLGTTLDNVGRGNKRWEKWRPTVSIFQHEDLLIHRLELWYQKEFTRLAEAVAKDVEKVSPETEVKLHEMPLSNPWDFEEVYAGLHDFAREYPFDPNQEDYLFHITTGTHVAQICLYLLTEARYFPGRLLQSAPSPKWDSGLSKYQIIDLDLSKYDRIASRFQREYLEDLAYLKSGIETRSTKFNKMMEQIQQVALASKAPILLMGPTGAGKSQLAKRIYDLKKQRGQVLGKLIEVNCATIRGDGAMSTLFGHKKGSYTGAIQEREGLLKAATGGVLFLDEIGELGADEQAMLLRAIEEKRFLPIGSDQETQSDFQLIAGTNRNLHYEVQKGNFREDLLARINLWSYRLLSLSERKEDIEPNLVYELERFAKDVGSLVSFNKEAKDQYLKFALSPQATWKANFRDLNASMTRMATLAPGGRITKEVVGEEKERLLENWQEYSEKQFKENNDEDLLQLLGEKGLADVDPFDLVQLREVVRICKQSTSLSDAGRNLFAVSRARKQKPNDADRLRKYLARFQLTWDQIRQIL